MLYVVFFFSSRRRHTRWNCDWSSDVCSSDLLGALLPRAIAGSEERIMVPRTGSPNRWLVEPTFTARFTKRALVEMQEREKILLGEEKNEPSRLVNSWCLLTEPTPS